MMDWLIAVIVGVIGVIAYGAKKQRDGRAEQKKEAEDAARKAISDARRARRDAASGELRDDDGFRRD